MNPFNVNEVRLFMHESSSSYISATASIEAEHEKSGIVVKIKRARDRASILDMRAEALNEIEWLVSNSPRYQRMLKDAQETEKGKS
jgi:hypothetical protein